MTARRTLSSAKDEGHPTASGFEVLRRTTRWLRGWRSTGQAEEAGCRCLELVLSQGGTSLVTDKADLVTVFLAADKGVSLPKV